MAKLTMLKSKRTVVRRSVTLYLKKIETFLESDSDNLVELEESLEFLKLKEIELNKIDDNIEQLIDDLKELEDDIDSSQEYKDKIILWKVRAEKRIKQNRNQNSSNENAVSNVNKFEVADSVKLPKLELPTFSGNIIDWITFKDLFRASVVENCTLSNAQKLQYLKSSLRSEAQKIVQAIPISDSNFKIAWNLLDERYSNKREQMFAIIRKFFAIPNIHTESAFSILNLVDSINEFVRTLETLEQTVDEFGEILLVYLVIQKLDNSTKLWWERELKGSEIPKLHTLIEFLKNQARTLQNSGMQNKTNPVKFKSMQNKTHSLITNNKKSISNCPLCKSNHSIYDCEKFLRLKPVERYELAKKLYLCLNCLNPNHKLSTCNSKYSCKYCKSRHNSLLHMTQEAPPIVSSVIEVNEVNKKSSFENRKTDIISENENDRKSKALSSCLLSKHKTVLLSTAVLLVENSFGQLVKARAILDNGSQSNFITSEFAHIANLKKEKINISVSSLGGSTTSIKSQTIARISNGNNSYSRSIDFLIVNKITDLVPSMKIDIGPIEIPHKTILADPNFLEPSKVDILIGAEVFFEIVKGEQIRCSLNSLIFQETVFGYIATGAIKTNSKPKTEYCGLTSNIDNIEKSIEKFWLIENIGNDKPLLSEEEEFCEKHFKETHKRDENGRFIVTMPIKEIDLGDSKSLATIRLNQLNKRLDKNPVMKQLYHDFLLEYENLNHMEKVIDDVNPPVSYYMPHHGVFRPEKTSTKLRVVFNASSPTSTGKSLNDILLTGEVKEDVFDLIVRFRKHKIALTADITKMFRQILIDPSQRDLLRILWKTQDNAQPSIFRMKTVTYGTKNAPFLAIRTLKQLAMDEGLNYPLASKAVLEDIYMDDLVTGSHDFDSALELKFQLIQMFHSCGMTLHKWNSNFMNLITDCGSHEEFSFDTNESTKTLGIVWLPKLDKFTYKVSQPEQSTFTKRDVLSIIAKLYDPIGFLGPVITRAKIMLQRLWTQNLSWDEKIKEPIASEWRHFVSHLKALESIQIDRYFLDFEVDKIAIVGFADASIVAYGAVVYLHPHSSNSSFKILASKSRVAPLKTVSVPRLELCACLLLAKLAEKVIASLKMEIVEVTLFSDSTIALAWINSSPHLLKTFVGNRVSKIQTLSEHFNWKHISTENNPADFISRGVGPDELQSLDLWFSGPTSLDLQHKDLAESDINTNNELYKCEFKKSSDIAFTLTSSIDFVNSFLTLSNNFLKLIRILSYIYRFIHNCKNPSSKRSGKLSIDELNQTEACLVRSVQASAFKDELDTLSRNRTLSGKSKLISLNPFLDSNQVLRVGGRLQNANVDYSKKHPAILPSDHVLTKIIMTDIHVKNFHLGPQALLYCTRERFWPLRGRSIARKIVHNCIICFKQKPFVANQLMGSLPRERVNPSYPFLHSGIDYCGPFFIKYKHQRKGTFQKIYVAIFICLATKAIHIEVVSDLTTDAFLATLKRFIARRGKCATVSSDNATNFVGASRELKKLQNLLRFPDEKLTSYLTSENIVWNFIPPRSPNFGGLWESGVKSFKFYLKRAVGNLKLTLEEFLTVTTQVEGILNSRPLTPMSQDIDDLEILTPGHFLVGRPLTAIAEPNVLDIAETRLSRWQRLTKIVQHIWVKWSRDYLNNLQQRTKWQIEKDNISLNAMVLIKDENLPVNQWCLGRIIKLFPGTDGKIRVAEVRTSKGTVKRSISKLCILPLETS